LFFVVYSSKVNNTVYLAYLTVVLLCVLLFVVRKHVDRPLPPLTKMECGFTLLSGNGVDSDIMQVKGVGFQSPILALRITSRQSFLSASSLLLHHFYSSVDISMAPRTTYPL
jgi:hypothetical protein